MKSTIYNALPSLKPQRRVGIYGGSFDPVHDGHLHVAKTAQKHFDLHKVIWLVTPQNRLKTRRATAMDERLNLLRTRLRSRAFFVSDFERLIGSTKMVKSLQAINARSGGAKIYLLMGADSFATLHHWWRWKALGKLAQIIVVSRPSFTIKAGLSPAATYFRRRGAMKSSQNWQYCLFYVPYSPLSSTKIRIKNS